MEALSKEKIKQLLKILEDWKKKQKPSEKEIKKIKEIRVISE